MDLNLSVNKIYDQYKNGLLDRDSTFQSLKWMIENDPSDDVRAMSIKIIGRLKVRSEEMYKFLENLVISDSNSYIRFVAVKIILKDFPSQCSKPILWLIAREQFPFILKLIYDSILKSDLWDHACLKAEFTRILESRFGVILSEVAFFLDLEVSQAQYYSRRSKFLTKSTNSKDKPSEHQIAVNYYTKYGLELEKILEERNQLTFYAVQKMRVVNLELNKKRVKILPRSLLTLSYLLTLDISGKILPNWLKPLPNLEFILLRGIRTKNIPDWVFLLASKFLAQAYIKEGVNPRDAMVLGLIDNLRGERLVKKEGILTNDLENSYKTNDSGHVIRLAIYYMYDGTGIPLHMIPRQISHFEYLEELYLMASQIKFIPDELGKLSHLKRLDLSYNQIESVPASIGFLKSLEKLNLDNNNVNALPDSIGALKSLKILNLNSNNLKNLPESIGNLSSLEVLDLFGNDIHLLPASMGKLISLKINPLYEF